MILNKVYSYKYNQQYFSKLKNTVLQKENMYYSGWYLTWGVILIRVSKQRRGVGEQQ